MRVDVYGAKATQDKNFRFGNRETRKQNSKRDSDINIDYKLIAVERGFSIGCLIAHFKRETVDIAAEPMKYLYLYLGLARHTETDEIMVVYKPLYKTECIENVNWVIRPAAMFFSEVDHEKYPDIKAQYRFYLINN